jgi:hypothetical protein
MNQNTKNGFAPAPEANQGCRDWAIHRPRNGFGSEHGLATNDFAASPHFDGSPTVKDPLNFGVGHATSLEGLARVQTAWALLSAVPNLTTDGRDSRRDATQGSRESFVERGRFRAWPACAGTAWRAHFTAERGPRPAGWCAPWRSAASPPVESRFSEGQRRRCLARRSPMRSVTYHVSAEGASSIISCAP